MVPTVSHSSSQSKISDTFRSSSKATKPIKETKVSVSKRPTKPLTPTPVTQPNDQKHLNPNDPKLLSVARAIESNRQAPFVHPENQSTIHTILRNFDLSPKYGPCVGISRLDRYRRAEKMGLKPPLEVLQILETEEGQEEWNTDLFTKKAAV